MDNFLLPAFDENVGRGILARPIMVGEIQKGDSLFSQEAISTWERRYLIIVSSSEKNFTSFKDEVKKFSMSKSFCI